MARGSFNLRHQNQENKSKAKEKIQKQSTVISNEFETLGTLNTSIISENVSDLMKYISKSNSNIDLNNLKNHKFPFENIVMEGGGIKGVAYAGALMVLDEADILKKIKRICGTSIGSISATILAIGYTPLEMKDILFEARFKKVLIDHKCGYCSLLPNIRKKFGWNPGKRFIKWIKGLIGEKTGNPELTFRELYQLNGKELCIAVTNLSQMSTQYCHVKTTPNLEISCATRMSIAIPGLFQSVHHCSPVGTTDVFIDGGVLCNYPIHAFDGWWLSMKSEDSYFKKMRKLKSMSGKMAHTNRFGEWNPKTIGMLLYSENESEVLKSQLLDRKALPVKTPRTKLSKKYQKHKKRQKEVMIEKEPMVEAASKLIEVLDELDLDDDQMINRFEFKKICETSIFGEKEKYILFGDCNLENAFDQIDKNEDGQITFGEVLDFLYTKGVDIPSKILGYNRKEIVDIKDFIATIQDALFLGLKKSYMEERDLQRTIGIDTGYLATNNFDLEAEDVNYLIECGIQGTLAFLRDYISNEEQQPKIDEEQVKKIWDFNEPMSLDIL